jgi:hypothetical protein
MNPSPVTPPDGPGAGPTPRRPGTLLGLLLLAVPLAIGACATSPVEAQGGGRHGQAWAAASAPASAAPADDAWSGPSTDAGAAADDGTSTEVTPSPEPATADLPASDLSAADITAITYMREEEKLAHDVYRRLGDLWGSRVFTNIESAENAHMDAVGGLLVTFGIPDPAASTAAGEFTNPELQALYDRLVEQGSGSLADAFIVGATIEDLDIADLQQRASTNATVARVFDSLERGSRNHLRAFVRQLDRVGASYTPAFITPEAFDAIVGGRQETGRD